MGQFSHHPSSPVLGVAYCIAVRGPLPHWAEPASGLKATLGLSAGPSGSSALWPEQWQASHRRRWHSPATRLGWTAMRLRRLGYLLLRARRRRPAGNGECESGGSRLWRRTRCGGAYPRGWWRGLDSEAAMRCSDSGVVASDIARSERASDNEVALWHGATAVPPRAANPGARREWEAISRCVGDKLSSEGIRQ
jgi:hypothetical protein